MHAQEFSDRLKKGNRLYGTAIRCALRDDDSTKGKEKGTVIYLQIG